MQQNCRDIHLTFVKFLKKIYLKNHEWKYFESQKCRKSSEKCRKSFYKWKMLMFYSIEKALKSVKKLRSWIKTISKLKLLQTAQKNVEIAHSMNKSILKLKSVEKAQVMNENIFNLKFFWKSSDHEWKYIFWSSIMSKKLISLILSQ